MYKSLDELREDLALGQQAAEIPAGSPTCEVPLSQGDILDDCPLLFWLDDVTKKRDKEPHGDPFRVMIVTQACDLASKARKRAVVAVVRTTEQVVNTGVLSGRTIRDNVTRGRVYGWYFLPTDTSCPSFPESLVDLYDLHTIPLRILNALRDEGKHVCRLVTPHREHLAQHLATTYSRIALPDPYVSQ